MSNFVTDRNLLVGVLGLQMGFINESQLILAMQSWIFRKSEKIEDLLLEQKAIRSEMVDFLVGMAEKHIEINLNDPGKSLAAFSSIGPIRKQLKDLEDDDVTQSIARATEFRTAGKSAAIQSLDETASLPNKSKSSWTERFHILRPHAKGGLGQVSVAEDLELHREVALKEIQPAYAADPGSRSRFMLEAEVTGGLEHPGIVPVYSLGKTPAGNPFYVMRFIRGDSLKEAITHLHSKDNVLSPAEKRMTLRRLLGRLIDACNAIEYAHSRGVLHRDLKPGNIMLGKYGETLVVDWGLAKTGSSGSSRESADEATFMPLSGDSSTQTRMGSVVGTPAYMSPEQAEGNLDALGPASDVYGLGATMYSILTGLPPISNLQGQDILERVRTGQITPPRELNPDIPESLQAICLKALAIKQGDRYSTSAALADEIELWLSDESVLAFREPWIDRAARFFRRHRTAAISSLAVLLTAILALLIINVLVRQQNNDLRIARDMAESNRQEAEAARSKAEESRTEAIVQKNRAAENLVVAKRLSLSMLNTAEERLSAPAITSDIAMSLRMMLTEQAFTNFQSLYEQNRDDSDLAYEFAQTSRISANLKRLMRDFRTADDRIENSLQIQMQSPPDQLTLKRKDYLAETYRDIATLRRAEGRLADAELALAAGLAIVKELQEAEPDNPNFMRTLAVSEVEQIGLHSDRMELDMALQKANSSAATFQKLIDKGQSNAQDPILLLLAQARQVKLLYELGRTDDAKALATTVIPSGRQWKSDRAGDDNIALPVARILYWSAEGLVNAEGPSEDATARVVEALGIFEELVKKRLQSGYLYGKGDTLRVQAKILRLQKMFKDAENSLVQSRTVLETLVKAADKGDNRDILAKTLHEFSMLKLAENEKHSAVEFLKEAVDMQKEACRLSPESLELKTHLQELTLELKSLKAEF